MAGVDKATFFRWIDEGFRQEDEAFCDFRDRVERATNELCREAVQVQRKQLSHPDPRISGAASRFVLSYMFSGEFSTKQHVETTGPGGGPVQHQVEAKVGPLFTDEQLASMSPEQLTAALTGLAQVPATKKEGK